MLPSPSIGCWHGGQRGRTPSRPAAPLPRRFDRRVGKRRQAPRHLTTLLRRAGAPVRREAPLGCRVIVEARIVQSSLSEWEQSVDQTNEEINENVEREPEGADADKRKGTHCNACEKQKRANNDWNFACIQIIDQLDETRSIINTVTSIVSDTHECFAVPPGAVFRAELKEGRFFLKDCNLDKIGFCSGAAVDVCVGCSAC